MNINEFKKFYQEESINLNRKINNFNNDLVKDDNQLIKNNLEYFKNLNSDGKLIRGCLVNLGYYLIKDNKEYSDDLALAYEVFQTAILVHDDIIDRDELRRGKTTIHKANYDEYNKYSQDREELTNLSNSIALCMGDYGLFSANKIISDNYSNDPNLAKVLTNFNDIVLKTIKGELLDVILPFESKYKNLDNKLLSDSIMTIYKLKTAYYTIIGPLTIGLILAGVSDNKINEISKFGEKIGIAFQIQDDILGIYSDEIGKVVGSDIKEFKQTILYAYIANTKYKDELLKYYGQDNLNDEVIGKVREIFKESNAYNYSINLMNEYYDEGLSILNSIKWIDNNKKKILEGFVEYLRKRNK